MVGHNSLGWTAPVIVSPRRLAILAFVLFAVLLAGAMSKASAHEPGGPDGDCMRMTSNRPHEPSPGGQPHGTSCCALHCMPIAPFAALIFQAPAVPASRIRPVLRTVADGIVPPIVVPPPRGRAWPTPLIFRFYGS